MPMYKVIWTAKKYLEKIPHSEGVGATENAEIFAEENPDCYIISAEEYYSEFYVWHKNGKTEEEIIKSLPKTAVLLELYQVKETEGVEMPLLDEFVKRQTLSRADRNIIKS